MAAIHLRNPVLQSLAQTRRHRISRRVQGLVLAETSTRHFAFAVPADPLVPAISQSVGWGSGAKGFVEKPDSETCQRGLSRARMETKTREARVLGWQAYAASVRAAGLRLRDL